MVSLVLGSLQFSATFELSSPVVSSPCLESDLGGSFCTFCLGSLWALRRSLLESVFGESFCLLRGFSLVSSLLPL